MHNLYTMNTQWPDGQQCSDIGLLMANQYHSHALYFSFHNYKHLKAIKKKIGI